MSEWQPIDTAPRDGSRFLAFSTEFEGYVVLVSWAEHIEPWGEPGWAEDSAGPGYQNSHDALSHWMPLPFPPVLVGGPGR